MVIGAKEKLAANLTLFLGCFLAGLSTVSLLNSGSGASKEGLGRAGASTGLQDEQELQDSISPFFTGTGVSVSSSWFKTTIPRRTKKEID